jgi:hypothetical protein
VTEAVFCDHIHDAPGEGAEAQLGHFADIALSPCGRRGLHATYCRPLFSLAKAERSWTVGFGLAILLDGEEYGGA